MVSRPLNKAPRLAGPATDDICPGQDIGQFLLDHVIIEGKGSEGTCILAIAAMSGCGYRGPEMTI